ncbi:hypothetical protein BXZ70DRAFT_175300 [Cristinia sonorae]|uniref:F-box domain-containing protein n=1 Tax=Cristinia sonorae TaxID=1940300 RepID=A0A8K0UNT5_9AGAR|nr:hypothetical protein BXZ70DRAFT_175300 [Cristinia sonorae]
MHMFRNTPGVSQLPAELITLILQELSYTDLLRCERVSKHYRKLIRGTSVLQYKIELAQSGMDDIPSNGLSTATKREILARHTNATQTWPDHMVTKQTIPLLEGPLWELCGGVLAQSDGRRDLDFWQLPSAIRGITPRKWGVDVEFDIADFTVDPSQDLLVAMEVQSPTCFAHLLSLNTGKPHDGAAEKSLSFPLPPFDTPNRSYHIRVCGDFVGIIIRVYGLMSDEPHTVLGISNWKTGETKLLTSFWGIRSFAFLDDRHAVILRGVPRVPSPDVPGQESASNVVVSVIDFRKAVPPNAMSEAPLCPCVTLNLPTVADRWEVWHAEVVCDPSPACPPPNGPVASGGSSVPPFRVTHTDRIVVIRINGVDTLFEQAHPRSKCLQLPRPRLLRCLWDRRFLKSAGRRGANNLNAFSGYQLLL